LGAHADQNEDRVQWDRGFDLAHAHVLIGKFYQHDHVAGGAYCKIAVEIQPSEDKRLSI